MEKTNSCIFKFNCIKMSDIDDSDDFFASSSSSDDGLELINNHKIKNERFIEETVQQYDNETYFGHFRISRHVTTMITDLYRERNYFKKDRHGQFGKIPADDQVLIFMWFVGHQTASFRDVADRFNITLSSLHRIIERLTYFLSNYSPQIIKWPNNEQKRESEMSFRANGFPMAIGAIDGSHIQIDKPDNDPDSYINRKGYYSIQMQVVCDHNRKIIDFFAGYPGSVHDSRVFRNSPLCNTLEEKCGPYFLLGDSGYPLQTRLMTPFKDRGQLTRRQINYNLKLSQNRYRIEHCFGILKQKFRQLYHLKFRNITKIVHFMRACCVLHNIAIDDEFLEEISDDFHASNAQIQAVPQNQGILEEEDIEEDNDAKRIRDRIVDALFI